MWFQRLEVFSVEWSAVTTLASPMLFKEKLREATFKLHFFTCRYCFVLIFFGMDV